jgi:hypothetical protein
MTERKVLGTRDPEVIAFLKALLGNVDRVRSVTLRFTVDAPVTIEVERFAQTGECPPLMAEGYELVKRWGGGHCAYGAGCRALCQYEVTIALARAGC